MEFRRNQPNLERKTYPNMASFYHIVASLSVLLFFVTHSSAFDAVGNFCSSTMSNGSQIETNIGHLLIDLTHKFEQGATFLEASNGKGKNQVYGLGQCRGDVDHKNCLGCIHDAAQEIQKLCPNEPDARVWYDYCFLRYSPYQFYGKLDMSNSALIANQENVNNPDSFSKELGLMFDKLIRVVAKPGSGGTAEAMKDLSKFDTLYGEVECTKDLSLDSCAKCLDTAVENFKGYQCSGKKGCRVFYDSCFVRYELYPFFYSSGYNEPKGENLKKIIIHK